MATYQEVLDEAQQLSSEEQEQLCQALEKLAKHSATEEPEPKKNRIPGLNRGQIWISDDFNAPLPDEYLDVSS